MSLRVGASAEFRDCAVVSCATFSTAAAAAADAAAAVVVRGI